MRMAAALFVLLSAWLLVVPSAQARRIVYAIAIGNNATPSQEPGLEPLRYADDDAIKWLQLWDGGPGEAALLTTLDADTARRFPQLMARARAPSYANLRATLERYRWRMRADRVRGDVPVLFVTFSGHGSEDSLGHPALALSDVGLTRSLLYGELLPLTRDAETHLVVDACRAAGVLGVRGAFELEIEGTTARLEPATQRELFQALSLSAFPNVGVLIASSADEETHEWSRIEAGVFSHELISALRGAADVNGDRVLAYSEVRAFVAAANRDIVSAKARPQLIAHVPNHAADATLLDLSDLAGVRLLQGDAAALGRFHVELSNGQRLLDAHLAAGTAVALALPAQSDVFVRRVDSEAELYAGTQRARIDALRFAPRALVARGSLERELRVALFATAYGPTYYRGYIDSAGLSGVSFAAPKPLDAEPDPGLAAGLRRKLAIASAALGAAALIGCVVSTALSVSSKRDFQRTDREREAHALRDAYQRRLTAAITTGGVFVAAAGSALWLWPDWTPSREPRAGLRARLEF